MSDIDYHSITFRHRDKTVRAQSGLSRLCSHLIKASTPTGELRIDYLGLINQRKLAIRQRLRKRLLNIGRIQQLIAQLAREYIETVFHVFRLVHSGIRSAEQFLKGSTVIGVSRDADTGPQHEIVFFYIVRRRYRLQQGFCASFVIESFSLSRESTINSSPPCRQTRSVSPQISSRSIRYLFEQDIAIGMPVTVIDVFEIIEVDEIYREGAMPGHRSIVLPQHAQILPVTKPGQEILARLPDQLCPAHSPFKRIDTPKHQESQTENNQEGE